MCVCVRKIECFCRFLLTRHRNGEKICYLQESFPEKTKCVTTYFYCIIRLQLLDLSSNQKIKQIYGKAFFSSPEPSGSQGELIVYPYSGVRCRRCRYRRRRRQQCLNIFSSETTLPIKAKFYVEPPWEGGTKVCINGPGHMTKMAAMPIYGKNL